MGGGGGPGGGGLQGGGGQGGGAGATGDTPGKTPHGGQRAILGGTVKEFAQRMREAGGERKTPPGWFSPRGPQGMVPVKIPGTNRSVLMNPEAAAAAQKGLDWLKGHGYNVNALSGYRQTYAPGGSPSHHWSGNVFDINPAQNPRGGKGNFPPGFYEYMESIGFGRSRQGHNWSWTDPMHFEYTGLPERNRRTPTSAIPSLPPGVAGTQLGANNPTNLDFAGQLGATPGRPEEGGTIANFDSLERGMAQGAHQALLNYSRGLHTMRQMIGRWSKLKTAPQSVANNMHIGLDEDLHLDDPVQMERFLRALTKQEDRNYAKKVPDSVYKFAAGTGDKKKQAEKRPTHADTHTTDAAGFHKDISERASRTAFLAGRALGGPVSPGHPYTVGERGPETFVPDEAGAIVPHGINLGNIRSKKGGFKSFPDMYTASHSIVDQVKKYWKWFHADTIPSILKHYSPPNENPTTKLIKNMLRRTNLGTGHLDFNDPATKAKFAYAISVQEGKAREGDLGQFMQLFSWRSELEHARSKSRPDLFSNAGVGPVGAAQQAPTGSASLSIDLNGFPRGTTTKTQFAGMFRELKLNRGRAAPLEQPQYA